jgi:hypothetical protein
VLHQSPILTDKHARQSYYTARGLVWAKPATYWSDRPAPSSIRQGFTYRFLHSLLRAASAVRW